MAQVVGPGALQRPEAWPTITAAMEFGFSLPGRGPLARPDHILAMAARAVTDDLLEKLAREVASNPAV